MTVVAPAWRVHLPTVTETCVRLSLGPRDPRDPWPLPHALTELASLGAVRDGRFRALGSGRGEPLMASQTLRWRGCELHVETLHHRAEGIGEAALALPPWDELVASEAGEDDVWELVDAFGAAVGGRHGAVVDGEPLELASPTGERGWRERLRHHVALLVPAGDGAGGDAWAYRYRALPRSGLDLLIR